MSSPPPDGPVTPDGEFAEFYLPKISSSISIICSNLILAEIATDAYNNNRNGSNNWISRILVSMSIGDIFLSFGWFFGTWASPADDPVYDYLNGTNHGTNATCSAQAFVIVLGGIATLFFNASLALVYYWMILYHWREPRIRPKVQCMTLVIWMGALVAATLPLFWNMYHNSGPICWIAPYPWNCQESWQLPPGQTPDCTEGDGATLASIGLLMVPTWLCIIFALVMFLCIYAKARHLERLQAKNNMRASQESQQQPPPDPAYIQPAVPPQLQKHSDESDENDIQVRSSVVSSNSASTRNTRTPNGSKKYSRQVAEQGLWYIAGFIATFILTTMSIVVLLATGHWSPSLDRAGYFFVSLQGLWNFMNFSRRRLMSTWVGAHARALIWDVILGLPRWLCQRICSKQCCKTKGDPAIETVPSDGEPRRPSKQQQPQQQSSNSYSAKTLPPNSQQQPTRIPTLAPISEEGYHSNQFCDPVNESTLDVPINHPWFSLWLQKARHTVSEISMASSTEETTLHSSRGTLFSFGNAAEKPPVKPIRYDSENDGPGDNAFRIDIECVDSTPPVRPERVDSVAKSCMDARPARIPKTGVVQNQSYPPVLPVRLESEVVSELEDPTVVVTSDPSRPPVKPMRFESEVSQIEPNPMYEWEKAGQSRT